MRPIVNCASLALLAALSAACSPRPAAPAPMAVTDSPTSDAARVEAASLEETVSPPPPDAGVATSPLCPPSFDVAQTSQCILAKPARPACEYAEGSCACGAPTQCGGAYMPHPPGSPGTVYCTPKSPNALRADGCPFTPPKKGQVCAGTRSCTYGPCTWSQTIATCKGGAWDVVEHHSAPPP